MSITVMERSNSRPLVVDPKAMSATREYWVKSDDIQADASEINDAIAVVSPNVYLGLVKKKISSDPQGAGFWYGTVDYGTIEGRELEGQQGSGNAPTPEEYQDSDKLGGEFSFTTSGGTQHINQSLRTMEYARRGSETGASGPLPPNYKGAIGVSKSGVAGCDIIVPKFEITITRRISFIDHVYVKGLVACTGCVNVARWNTYNAGEVLFLGAEGRFDGDGRQDQSWLVTFKLAISKNEAGIVIVPNTMPIVQPPEIQFDNSLTIQVKEGWDYLWVGFAESADADSGLTVQAPEYAYVERVYYRADFKEYLGF